MIILPINSYIIKNMNLTVKGKKINSWITKNNAKEIMNNVNNLFFNKYNIHWDLKEIIEFNVPNTANLKFIEELSRDTTLYPNDKREKVYCSLIKKNMYSKKYNNIYFSTFNGNTRQGKANINKNKHIKDSDLKTHIHFTLIGTHTNKHNNGNKPKRREIYKIDEPSLSFTVAHELAHVLGLKHLNSKIKNIMNAVTSSFEVNQEQISIMKKKAKEFNNIYHTESNSSNSNTESNSSNSNTESNSSNSNTESNSSNSNTESNSSNSNTESNSSNSNTESNSSNSNTESNSSNSNTESNSSNSNTNISLSQNKIYFFEPVSPLIKRIKKDKNNVLVEWDNDNINKVKKFIVIYKNQDNPDKSTWILRNIKSNKPNNSLILRDMYGQRYHITILAVYINKEKKELVSEVGRIILFGDGNDYNGIDYNKKEDIDLNIRNDREEINNIINNPSNNIINNIYGNNIVSEENSFGRISANNISANNISANISDNISDNQKESIVPVPTINCDGKVNQKNIRSRKDLEDIDINYRCPEDNEIEYLRDEIRNYRPFFSFF